MRPGSPESFLLGDWLEASAFKSVSRLSPVASGFAATADDAKSRESWLRLLASKSAGFLLGCADQAIVSLSNFAALVMVGRWTDLNQLGAYAVGFSVLALSLAMQEALVSRPYTIQLHRPLGTKAEHAFNALALSVLIGVLLTVVFGALALLLTVFYAESGLIQIVWALAAALPFVLLREFGRRFAFAHLDSFVAVKIDFATAILMVGAIGALGMAGELSAAKAIIAVGAACALPMLAWLYTARARFAWSVRKLGPALRQSWSLGKWFLSGQLAVQAQGYIVPWLALVLAGAASTGVYAACASVVAFANPLIYGGCNVLTPKYVALLKESSVSTLRRRVVCGSLLIGAAMAAFSILVLIFGDWVMRILYQGAEYTGHTEILGILSVAALVAVVGVPASLALAAAEHARTHASIKVVGAILTVLLVSALLPEWGIRGVTYGILVAEAIVSVAQWMAFVMLVRGPRGSRRIPTPSAATLQAK